MKRNIFYLFALIMALGLSACQKDFNERYLITDNSLEFEDAVTTTFAVGKDYPIVTRTVNPGNAEVSFQVNLMGLQPTENQNLQFRIVDGETTAVEGRDFAIANGKVFTINAGSSKGNIKIQSLPTGVGTTLLVLELVGNDKVKVSKNYRRVGVRCVYP